MINEYKGMLMFIRKTILLSETILTAKLNEGLVRCNSHRMCLNAPVPIMLPEKTISNAVFIQRFSNLKCDQLSEEGSSNRKMIDSGMTMNVRASIIK